MQQKSEQNPQLTTLLHHLQADFENEPVEDGMDHEAERTLARALDEQAHENLLPWLTELCTNNTSPALASSVLRCLSSLPLPGTPEWRAATVRQGLASTDIEIRDAAIQAAEHWAEPSLVEALRDHEEPEKWLREYRDGVIADLTVRSPSETVTVTTRPKGITVRVKASALEELPTATWSRGRSGTRKAFSRAFLNAGDLLRVRDIHEGPEVLKQVIGRPETSYDHVTRTASMFANVRDPSLTAIRKKLPKDTWSLEKTSEERPT